MLNKTKKILRSVTSFEALPDEGGAQIIEGRAAIYDSPTCLWEFEGVKYYERIAPGAFDDADMKDCCLKYNHMDSVPILARTRGGSLVLDLREDGLYFRATLFNTSVARDCYELVRQGALKCSFAFTTPIDGESYDRASHTNTIKKVDRLFDVSVVDIPAYEDTYAATARSFFELEREKERLESLQTRRKLLIAKTYY